MSINFSLILPCYNEEKNIFFIWKEFIKLPIRNYIVELILVNNGSTDKTKKEINRIIKNNKFKKVIIKTINLKKNQCFA